MDNILSAEQSTISSQDLPYGYVYLTTNLINNKKYVGVHKSSCFDENYKGSGKILWRAISKYGWENFKTEIIKWCYSKEELFESERLEIEERGALSSSDYYNVMPGGCGGDNKTSLSPEEHDRFVQRIKDSKNNRPRTQKEVDHIKRLHQLQVGKPRSEESNRKSRESNLGQKRSREARKRMSESHADVSGEKNPMYEVHLVKSDEERKQISLRVSGEGNPMYGKKHSEESKLKMSKSHKGITKGKIWMTNKVDVETMIRPEEYEEFVSKGYVRGRLRKSQKCNLGR